MYEKRVALFADLLATGRASTDSKGEVPVLSRRFYL
jgi:hypothetical protein